MCVCVCVCVCPCVWLSSLRLVTDSAFPPCGHLGATVRGCGGLNGPPGIPSGHLGALRPRGSAGPTRTIAKCVYLRGQSQSANTSASWRPFHCGRRSRGIVLPWGVPSLAVESTILVANIKKENARLVSGCEQCLSVWWASCSPGLLAGLARSHVPPFPSLGADPRATNLRSVGIGVPFRLKAWLQSAAGRHPIGDSRARVPLLASAPHP